jgi:autotransporter-associated beta strand protein
MKIRTSSTLSFLCLLLLVEIPANAIVRTWINGAANNNFSANGNWSPSGSPVLAAPGDDLVFGSTNTVKPNMNDASGTSTNYSSVTFTNGGFTIRTAIDSRLMCIKAGSGITNQAGFSNGDNQIGPHVIMLGAMTVVNNNTNSQLIFVPDDRTLDKYTIDGRGNALTFDGPGNFVIGTKDLKIGAIKNIGSLTKKGTGVIEFWGTNTWTGDLSVQAGTARISTVNQLQASISIANGATLAAMMDHPGTTLTAQNLTLGTSIGHVTTNTFDFSAFGSPAAEVISVSNLAVNGAVYINVTGWGIRPGQFPLIKNQNFNSNGAGFLGNSFPAGISGFVSNNIANKSIDLVIPGPVVPMQADQFVDSIGVNIHLAFHNADTNFAVYNYTNTLAAVQALGIRHVRDAFGYWPAEDERNTLFNNLAANGIRFQATIGGVPTAQIADYAASLVVAANQLDPGALDWIEGVNEPNIFNLFMGPQDIVDLQAAIWTNFKADPIQQNLPILLPSLAINGSGNEHYTDGWDLAKKLGALNIQQYADYGNGHPYPNSWRMPEGLSRITDDLAMNRTFSPDLPLIVSEVQYSTPMPANSTGVDEWAAGIYTTRLLLELNERGIKRTSIYELFDLPGEGDGNFRFAGLYHSDGTTVGTIKPQGSAIKNMTALLTDLGPSFPVTNLNFTLSGGSLRSKLFQKRNGEYWLALWRPIDVGYWDGTSFIQNYSPPQDVTLTFKGGYVPSTITTYTDLGNPTMTTASLNPVVSLTIPEVGGMVKFVKITGSIYSSSSTVIDAPRFDDAGKLVLAGTNIIGSAGGTYSVLSSTNIAAPLASWTTNLSGVLGAGGSFSNAIARDPSDEQRFYLITTP